MWKLDLGIFIFQKSLGLLWACELAHSCSQKNAVIYWGKLSCKMLIHHTPLIQAEKKERKKENQQLVRAELSLQVLSWTQRADALEPPMPAVVGPPGTVSFPPQHTQNTLTAALWSENAQEKENVKEVSLVISFQRGEHRRTGYCMWILRTKPETQCNR